MQSKQLDEQLWRMEGELQFIISYDGEIELKVSTLMEDMHLPNWQWEVSVLHRNICAKFYN